MTRTSIGFVALVLIVALVATAGVVAVSGSALGDDLEDGENETENATDEPRFSFDELRDGGTQLQDSPPSVRSDGERMWWLEHWPADAVLTSPGEIDDSGSEFVEPGGLVDRNSVWLRTVAAENAGERTVKVVYWSEGEDGPEDIIVDEHEVEIHAGMPMIEIDLRQSHDRRQVSMWIEGAEDSVRWTFEHESVATSEPVSISTQGDYLGSVALHFLIPILIGSALSGKAAMTVIQRAGMGPGIPLWIWLVAIGLGLGLLILFSFSNLAELLSSAPWVVSALVVAVVFVVVLESQAVRNSRVTFLRPDIESTVTPKNTEGADSIMAAEQEETIVEMPSGGSAIVRRGLIPFIARCFGRAAYVPSVRFESKIKLPSSKKDELILVDPEAQTVLEYEPETLSISLPEIDEWTDAIRPAGALIVIGSIAWGVGSWLSVGWGLALGLLLLLPLVVSPVDGRAEVEPASCHTRAAWISTMTLAQEVDDAKTLDDARESLVEAQSSRQRDIQEALESQDSTLIEEMQGTDLDRSLGLEDEDDVDEPDPFEGIDEIPVSQENGSTPEVSDDD